MGAAGIIVEYNPFHNGHLYHLSETKKVTGADVIIAVMSGNFLQRGEPAIVSKWTRTEMALLAGCDVVIELPYCYAVQKAEIFANGAISLLNSLFVNKICFGSESGSINEFLSTLEFMTTNKVQFDHHVSIYMKEGNSYPKATSLAFKELNPTSDMIDLSQPNNILGYHYIKAIHDQDTTIKPYTIKRHSAGYHDENFATTTIASATSIRKSIFSSQEKIDTKQVMPIYSYERLMAYLEKQKLLHQWENYFCLLKYRILTSSLQELRDIYEMEEGIEHRLVASIKGSNSFIEFMNKLKTKRYTWTRLQRLCVHILTNTKKNEVSQILKTSQPSYIRLLGMNKKGQNYLSSIKKQVAIPIVSTVSSFDHDMGLQMDIKATTTFAMGIPTPYQSSEISAEYSTPPIRL